MAAENPDELAAEKAKAELRKAKDARNVLPGSKGEEGKHEADDDSTQQYDDDDDESTLVEVKNAKSGKVKAPGDGGDDDLSEDPVEELRRKYAPLISMKDTAIVDIPSRNGTRPIHIAATYNSLNVLALLIRVGSEFNGVDSAGENSLHKAARRCNTDAYKMLLEAGAYENVKNTSRETAAELLKDASMI